jgi:hypothetical protein
MVQTSHDLVTQDASGHELRCNFAKLSRGKDCVSPWFYGMQAMGDSKYPAGCGTLPSRA